MAGGSKHSFSRRQGDRDYNRAGPPLVRLAIGGCARSGTPQQCARTVRKVHWAHENAPDHPRKTGVEVRPARVFSHCRGPPAYSGFYRSGTARAWRPTARWLFWGRLRCIKILFRIVTAQCITSPATRARPTRHLSPAIEQTNPDGCRPRCCVRHAQLRSVPPRG
jgi:hypothetical protein